MTRTMSEPAGAAMGPDRPAPGAGDRRDERTEERRTVSNRWFTRLVGKVSGPVVGLAERVLGPGVRYGRDLPAVAVSLAFHGALLAALGVMGYAAQAEIRRDMTGAVVDTAIPAFDKAEIQEMDEEMTANPEGSSAPVLAPLAVAGSAPILVASRSDSSDHMTLSDLKVTRPGDLVMPAAATLSQAVSIRGSGAEHVGGVEGAVDRVALEILGRLERGRTLVIWAFDASGSLQAEREKLAGHIEQVYAHIDELDQSRISADEALLTQVIAFGQDRKAMTPAPTADRAAIVQAIKDVPLDATGVETTFQTVAEISRKWGKFKNDKGAYHPIIIVVTDEVGDDEQNLEGAISAANAAKVPVYVLGSPALFGKLEGRMDYTDPKTKKTFRNLPVRQGPESVALEQIRLPFWYNGDQYDNLDAGFGPYALSRLAGATGGIYFITRLGPSRLSFDPNGMREYRPDWVSKAQYEQALAKDPIRGAVIQAALITQQNLPGQPGLVFPPADAPEFKEAMTNNQEIVARIAYTVDEALVPISAVAKQRDRETSRRWQAHFDLIRGRLMAMKIRCYEYNTACARMKREPMKFKKESSNAWRLAPTETIDSGAKVAAVAVEAKRLLEGVVKDHPNTPWALLAQRELKDPMGFQWVETKVPPLPKRMESEAAAKKKAMTKPAMKPEEPPKL
ncbi:vWA domain-containing protein [Tundrisphaera sp. TA3]|uniref:vWA domain-containing protein n=1 Tax=Tundrisphaera sp. TA3 TaxID=3435775 RepID=UPI003EBA5237